MPRASSSKTSSKRSASPKKATKVISRPKPVPTAEEEDPIRDDSDEEEPGAPSGEMDTYNRSRATDGDERDDTAADTAVSNRKLINYIIDS
jgi:hypothetical protein